jgi:hypothetical protein
MASGAVRKRTRTRRNGEVTVTWFVDYYDQHRRRHYKTFHSKGAAAAGRADAGRQTERERAAMTGESNRQPMSRAGSRCPTPQYSDQSRISARRFSNRSPRR